MVSKARVTKVVMGTPSRLCYLIALSVLLLGMVLSLASCREPGEALGGENQASPDRTTASPAPAQTIAAEVSLTEYAIQMPVSLAAGPQLFRVTNNGASVHNLEVEGLGIEETFESKLSSEQSSRTGDGNAPERLHPWPGFRL
jgi:hypothetical protein